MTIESDINTMAETWGHLFPSGYYYEGSIIMARPIYGGNVILHENIDILSSPWWYHAIHDFIHNIDIDAGNVLEISIAVKIIEDEDGKSFQVTELKRREIL